MKKIGLVVGNGLDLGLGLPTSFGHFLDSPEFGNLLESGNNRLCFYLNNVNKASRWIDVEKELANYSRENPSNAFLYDEYIEFKDAFYDYIARIDSQEYEINKDSNAYQVFAYNYFLYINSKDSIQVTIVNFNYTRTFDRVRRAFMGNKMTTFFDLLRKFNRIFNDDRISHIKIIHPHGSIKDNHIILGVEDKADISEEHIFLKKSCDPNFKSFQWDLNDCDKIIIFGHSLGKTDHTYFKSFFLRQCEENVSPKDIRISYYQKEGYYQIIKQLDALTNQNLTKLKSLNKLKLIDVSEPGAWSDFFF